MTLDTMMQLNRHSALLSWAHAVAASAQWCGSKRAPSSTRQGARQPSTTSGVSHERYIGVRSATAYLSAMTGLRFSMNAAMPSFWSCSAKQDQNSRLRARVRSAPRACHGRRLPRMPGARCLLPALFDRAFRAGLARKTYITAVTLTAASTLTVASQPCRHADAGQNRAPKQAARGRPHCS